MAFDFDTYSVNDDSIIQETADYAIREHFIKKIYFPIYVGTSDEDEKNKLYEEIKQHLDENTAPIPEDTFTSNIYQIPIFSIFIKDFEDIQYLRHVEKIDICHQSFQTEVLTAQMPFVKTIDKNTPFLKFDWDMFMYMYQVIRKCRRDIMITTSYQSEYALVLFYYRKDYKILKLTADDKTLLLNTLNLMKSDTNGRYSINADFATFIFDILYRSNYITDPTDITAEYGDTSKFIIGKGIPCTRFANDLLSLLKN